MKGPPGPPAAPQPGRGWGRARGPGRDGPPAGHSAAGKERAWRSWPPASPRPRGTDGEGRGGAGRHPATSSADPSHLPGWPRPSCPDQPPPAPSARPHPPLRSGVSAPERFSPTPSEHGQHLPGAPRAPPLGWVHRGSPPRQGAVRIPELAPLRPAPGTWDPGLPALVSSRSSGGCVCGGGVDRMWARGPWRPHPCDTLCGTGWSSGYKGRGLASGAATAGSGWSPPGLHTGPRLGTVVIQADPVSGNTPKEGCMAWGLRKAPQTGPTVAQCRGEVTRSRQEGPRDRRVAVGGARNISALKAKGLSWGEGLGGGRSQERQRGLLPSPMAQERARLKPPLPHPFLPATPKTKGGGGSSKPPHEDFLWVSHSCRRACPGRL